MIEKKKLTGIKSWPLDDRPREKLLKKGAGALSNSELLAILLRTGTKGTSAIDLARNVLKKFGTFRNMAHTYGCAWLVGRGGFKGLTGVRRYIRIRRCPLEKPEGKYQTPWYDGLLRKTRAVCAEKKGSSIKNQRRKIGKRYIKLKDWNIQWEDENLTGWNSTIIPGQVLFCHHLRAKPWMSNTDEWRTTLFFNIGDILISKR